ncbi:Guanosine-3',5'-bis(diphosphate) 3'-pyrophosphohydrolase [Candidatus Nitrosotalea sp. TS]|uniref:HD domain-containing protein n=1 Tax=Candidatus Nitrosotalea sp. TS TaxID=2341020 RepID=UPI00140C5334|nr:HD domain-containing protein [Candidatus Nitrosotalea sp. TS]NHI03151.1 Guanosine-3',5'-bis(diphosphate) 3'-pyrophosphohydrolase [Candidatus Nitrosotalea sp. TS]
MTESVRKKDFLLFIEKEAKIHIDSYIESAIHLAEEVHSGVRREDGASSFLETHIFPVTINVIRHYKRANKPMTTIQIVSAILHDVMEDNERILDLHASKSYGFDAYFSHRFGEYVYRAASTLKTKPLEIYPGLTDKERELERFREYCNVLTKSDYDVKVIKLADRLNNMRFISKVPGHEKVSRYMKEAEDFYIAYTIIEPRMDDFYSEIREAYEDLRKTEKEKTRITA